MTQLYDTSPEADKLILFPLQTSYVKGVLLTKLAEEVKEIVGSLGSLIKTWKLEEQLFASYTVS